jgi:hypothetical protein
MYNTNYAFVCDIQTGPASALIVGRIIVSADACMALRERLFVSAHFLRLAARYSYIFRSSPAPSRVSPFFASETHPETHSRRDGDPMWRALQITCDPSDISMSSPCYSGAAYREVYELPSRSTYVASRSSLVASLHVYPELE